jgi:hypothetical protein
MNEDADGAEPCEVVASRYSSRARTFDRGLRGRRAKVLGFTRYPRERFSGLLWGRTTVERAHP